MIYHIRIDSVSDPITHSTALMDQYSRLADWNPIYSLEFVSIHHSYDSIRAYSWLLWDGVPHLAIWWKEGKCSYHWPLWYLLWCFGNRYTKNMCKTVRWQQDTTKFAEKADLVGTGIEPVAPHMMAGWNRLVPTVDLPPCQLRHLAVDKYTNPNVSVYELKSISELVIWRKEEKFLTRPAVNVAVEKSISNELDITIHVIAS